jgi:branched-chain amino acid transport system substrate-binding protein
MATLSLIAVLAGCGSNNTASSSDTSTTAGTAGSATGGDHKFGYNNGSGADVIKIGLVTSENGDLKPWGIDSENGALMAIDEVNAAGGIHGKKVQLLVEDSNSKPDVGKSATEKLLSEGVVCVLGEVASGISLGMKGATVAAKVPQIAVGATRTDLTDGCNSVFRVCYTDKLQGPVMAKFAYDELRLRKMAIMTDNSQPYSQGLSASFREYFTKLGGQIVDEENYQGKQTAFSGQLTNLKAKNPDGVFCSGYFNEVGPIVHQAREAGIDKNVPFLGGDGWDSKEIMQSGGDAIVGSYFCNHYNNADPSPVVQAFLKNWKTASGGDAPATTMGALGYDAAKLACDAIGRATAVTPAAIRDALDNTVDFHGVSGDITLKGWHGNPPKRALVVQLTSDVNAPQKFVKAYDYFDLFPNEKPAGSAPAAPAAPAAAAPKAPAKK